MNMLTGPREDNIRSVSLIFDTNMRHKSITPAGSHLLNLIVASAAPVSQTPTEKGR